MAILIDLDTNTAGVILFFIDCFFMRIKGNGSFIKKIRSQMSQYKKKASSIGVVYMLMFIHL